MRKADLLDELRSEIGVVSDKCARRVEKLYESVCEILVKNMPAYEWVSIYLTEGTSFCLKHERGRRGLPDVFPFGEGWMSIAAVRGGVVREKIGNRTEVYVPFYRGHHLIGVFVVMGTSYGKIDDEDVSLFCELASLFETKAKECNS
jgi:L-methionine (R)-S-oxide reductase